MRKEYKLIKLEQDTLFTTQVTNESNEAHLVMMAYDIADHCYKSKKYDTLFDK